MWLNLGKILDDKKITLYKFAQDLGVPPSTVSTYFREGYDPKFSNVVRWCAILNIEITDLLDPSLKKRKIPKPNSAKIADQSKNPNFTSKVGKRKKTGKAV